MGFVLGPADGSVLGFAEGSPDGSVPGSSEGFSLGFSLGSATAFTERVAGSSASPSLYWPSKASEPAFVSVAGMSLKTIAPPSPLPGFTAERSRDANSTSSSVPFGVVTSTVIAPPVPVVASFTSESVMSRTPPWA